VDTRGNVLSTADPTGGSEAWQATAVDDEPDNQAGSSNGFLSGLSCPTDQFCAATDYAGNVLVNDDPGGDPDGWSLSPTGLHHLQDISCPTPSFCVLASFDGIAISTAPASGAWARPMPWGRPTLDRLPDNDILRRRHL
jgi:hypothetical protein